MVNLAIREAKSGLLLIINDDTIATEKLVEEHLLVHRLHPEETIAVLGRVTISEEVPPSIFARLHLDASFKSFEGKAELDWRAFITCNLSVKRSFLLRHELFEEKMKVLHEDLELGERLSHHGLKIIYRPEALGYHYHYIEENNFLSSAKQEGRSLAVWYKKSPHLKKVLASLGFYLTMPLYKRSRYVVADLLINRLTIPVFLPMARRLAYNHEDLSLKLYLKIYLFLKRESIRKHL
jgi:GT2 family glycosyltransferase